MLRTVDEETVLYFINSILNCRVSTLQYILTREGVPEIDIPELLIEEPVTPSTPLAAAPPITPTRPSHAPQDKSLMGSTIASPWTPQTVASPSNASEFPTPLTNPDDYSDEDRRVGTLAHFRRLPIPSSPVRDSGYRDLLAKVVSAARRTVFPDFNPSDLSTALQNLSVADYSLDVSSTVRYGSDWERRIKTGAAGELFVSK